MSDDLPATDAVLEERADRCRCHSDDPVLTEEHRNRRINDREGFWGYG